MKEFLVFKIKYLFFLFVIAILSLTTLVHQLNIGLHICGDYLGCGFFIFLINIITFAFYLLFTFALILFVFNKEHGLGDTDFKIKNPIYKKYKKNKLMKQLEEIDHSIAKSNSNEEIDILLKKKESILNLISS